MTDADKAIVTITCDDDVRTFRWSVVVQLGSVYLRESAVMTRWGARWVAWKLVRKAKRRLAGHPSLQQYTVDINTGKWSKVTDDDA